MFYLVNGLLLTIASMGFNSKRVENIVYRMLWIYLTVILCIRYGQGTDYFGYYINYTKGDAHSEYLWKTVTEILFRQGIKFEAFVAIIGFVSMILIDIAIRKYSANKCFSLLILYPTIYFVYLFSGIRMGLVIAIFMGVLVPLLDEKKYLPYYLLCVCLFFIHSATLIFLFIPFFVRLARAKQILIVIMSFIFGMVLCYMPAAVFYSLNIGALQFYIDERGIGFFALLEKTLILMLVILFYKKNDIFSGILFYTVAASFMTISWQFISSRFFVLGGCVYIILLSNIPRQQNKRENAVILWGVIVIYSILVLCKNVDAYLIQNSLNNITIFNCPYITIFNKTDYNEILEKMGFYRMLFCTE